VGNLVCTFLTSLPAWEKGKAERNGKGRRGVIHALLFYNIDDSAQHCMKSCTNPCRPLQYRLNLFCRPAQQDTLLIGQSNTGKVSSQQKPASAPAQSAPKPPPPRTASDAAFPPTASAPPKPPLPTTCHSGRAAHPHSHGNPTKARTTKTGAAESRTCSNSKQRGRREASGAGFEGLAKIPLDLEGVLEGEASACPPVLNLGASPTRQRLNPSAGKSVQPCDGIPDVTLDLAGVLQGRASPRPSLLQTATCAASQWREPNQKTPGKPQDGLPDVSLDLEGVLKGHHSPSLLQKATRLPPREQERSLGRLPEVHLDLEGVLKGDPAPKRDPENHSSAWGGVSEGGGKDPAGVDPPTPTHCITNLSRESISLDLEGVLEDGGWGSCGRVQSHGLWGPSEDSSLEVGEGAGGGKGVGDWHGGSSPSAQPFEFGETPCGGNRTWGDVVGATAGRGGGGSGGRRSPDGAELPVFDEEVDVFF